MRAIFLCNTPSVIARVFDDDTKARIAELCELDATVYTKADVLSSPASFSDVEIAFSSWGMPTFSEDEIKSSLPSL